MTLLFGALVVGKNIFLRQARAKLDTMITYSRLRLSYLPAGPGPRGRPDARCLAVLLRPES